MTEDILILRNKRIPVKFLELPVPELRYYAENPRLYSLISADGDIPDQEEIEEKLLQMDHVKQLIHSIKANGGLIEPIIVQDKTHIVFEGNSRLAAYRALYGKDPIKWGKIKCQLLPKDIDESAIFALLGEYHIIGRKDWAPYEQAGYLYRRHTRDNIELKELADDIGLGAKTVRHLIDVYQFMIDHKDNKVERWSYYYEYLKSRKIKKVRDAHPKLDQLVVKQVKNGEIARAADLRDKLPVVIEAGKKTLGRFLDGKKDLDESYESAQHRGTSNEFFMKLKKFRHWLADHTTAEDLESLRGEPRNKCRFELRHISKRSSQLLEKLGK